MAEFTWESIDKKAVDTARVLAADAVEKAGSGHPGTAMSLAPVAYYLFQKQMRFDPSDEHWIGRDRFILSPGHTSLTQYVQLYFAGLGLELDDLKQLRQYGSKTPGHPEYRHTRGVEMTTGPLGQGLASAVGFAMAARYERGLFDPEAASGESPFDHYIYVIASDGDIEEGVTSEASSLAGLQQLGNLVVIYDSNQISIEDDTNVALDEDTIKRYEAYGWHTQTVEWRKSAEHEYVEDVQALADAVEAAKQVTDRPSFIRLKTIIGWPAPNKQNTGDIHGSALGGDELRATKEILGFDPEASFAIADDVIEHTRENARKRGDEARAAWQRSFDEWAKANPERKRLLERLEAGELPGDIEEFIPAFPAGKAISTRKASGQVINALAKQLPELWGGSADLAGSNNTTIEGVDSFLPPSQSTKKFTGSPYGRVLHFGIREHAMGSILNGIVWHGPTRPFGGTFLIFSDYMRPPVRLAALSDIPSIFVWTHDSVALGGDGPTHQPIEQLMSLRAIPNLSVIRPADGNETAWAWYGMLKTRDGGPSGIVLSRQDLPVVPRGEGEASGDEFGSARGTLRGAYVLAEAEGGEPEVIIIATGSEVSISLEAREQLAAEGIRARVVSAPCLEWFDRQSEEYRERVLPKSVGARVSVEAGVTHGWSAYTGPFGEHVAIDHFGASADGDELMRRFGFTPEHVVEAAKRSLKNAAK